MFRKFIGNAILKYLYLSTQHDETRQVGLDMTRKLRAVDFHDPLSKVLLDIGKASAPVWNPMLAVRGNLFILLNWRRTTATQEKLDNARQEVLEEQMMEMTPVEAHDAGTHVHLKL